MLWEPLQFTWEGYQTTKHFTNTYTTIIKGKRIFLVPSILGQKRSPKSKPQKTQCSKHEFHSLVVVVFFVVCF